MPRIASELVEQAIKALAIEGVEGVEIHRRLLAGEAGLEAPVDRAQIAVRTVQQKRRRYIEEHRRTSVELEAGDEIETLNAILRQALRAASHEVKVISEKIARVRTSPSKDDAAALREWARTAAEIRRYFQGDTSQQQTASRSRGRKADAPSTLARLAAAEERAPAPDLDNGVGSAETARNGTSESPEGNAADVDPSGA